jgi:ribosomal protein S18 acetylase RimI-like enzyme
VTAETPLSALLSSTCPQICLREERDADLDFLQSLYASVRAQELAPVAWSEAEKNLFTNTQLALQRKHYREHYAGAEFLIVEAGGVAVGRIYLCRLARVIEIMDIAFVDAHRNAGLGTCLLRALIAIAETERRDVTLYVEHDNPAQRLYARFGFRFVERFGAYDFLTRDRAATDGAAIS